ncbi:MAG: guanylate kinase [Bdellovibrionota bacterium]
MSEIQTTPMIIVVGPSGVGKSSFVDKITKELSILFDTVTYTTRAMRKGESEGIPYHFVTEERFRELLKQSFFIEHAEVHGRLYGTPKHQIDDAIASGRVVIMDVDVQGAQTFKEKYPNAFAIFIHPPSIDELRRRVVKRDGKALPDLETRMANAQKEIKVAHQFDAELTNDDFERSYATFKKIIVEKLNLV